MKVLVTGAKGQLGSDVAVELKRRGHEFIGADIKEHDKLISLDIIDGESVIETVSRIRPDAVIHCAAWTDVDGAEEPSNREVVFNINFNGTKNIAEACKTVKCKLIYISTDYVFDGEGEDPWRPDEIRFDPLNHYGNTKLEGEIAIREIIDKYFIVRIAWVFGMHGNNFVKTMLKLGQTHDTIRVVNDQIGTPTYTRDLARLLVDMAETEKYGYYHATNEGGYISWYDFACEIFNITGINTEVIPVTTEEYGLSIARRPLNSRLDKSKLIQQGFEPLPDWKDALKRYLNELKAI